MSHCIICGKPDRNVCDEHWHKLPIKTRRQWWAETDYGKRPPPPDLVENVRVLYAKLYGELRT